MQSNHFLNKDFWNTRWENSETGWDVGYATPAIASFMSKYPNKDAAILIPGCGNAYEAMYLGENEFTNVTLIDIAPKAVEKLRIKFEHLQNVKIICDDFFNLEGHFDLVIEQTFFCALPPEKRAMYVQKMSELLNKNGAIMGVMFNVDFEKQGPPFGGSTTEYASLFNPLFNIYKMEDCYNSIPPRAGSEIFINFIKK